MLMSDGRPTSVLNQIYIYRLFKMLICDALRYLLPFVQFKKREKHHGGVSILVKLNKWYQIAQRIIYWLYYLYLQMRPGIQYLIQSNTFDQL